MNSVSEVPGTVHAGTAERSHEEKKGIEQLNLGQLLQEAVQDTDGINYEFADLILGKLASAIDLSHEQAVDLITVVIKHIPHLYPIISSVGLMPAPC